MRRTIPPPSRNRGTKIITTDLNELAEHLGATITTHTGGEKGRYYGGGLISLRDGLGPINRRCTLAHELAHHVLRHDPAATGWWRARQEREADRWASRLLISPADYAAAEAMHGPHPGAIAHELGVTVRLVEVWKDAKTAGDPR